MTVLYRCHPDIRITGLLGEGVALHLATRRYFTLSESGLTLLEALASPLSADELVALLVAEYEVTREHAGRAVRAFLERCTGVAVVLSVSEA